MIQWQGSSQAAVLTTVRSTANPRINLNKQPKAFDGHTIVEGFVCGDRIRKQDTCKAALDANFMQIDEVRYAEDLEPLGLDWIKLGLNDVLYDPKTKTIYTPNTNQPSVKTKARCRESRMML